MTPLRAVRALPLRYRLPNAPAVFVGRDVEAERLRGAIERGPVALVWGLGGLGKTSLVLHTLHAGFPERVGSVLLVGLRPGDPPEQLRVETLRALLEAHRLPLAEQRALEADATNWMATAIDLAEQGGFWVVLDDLHNGDADVVREFLSHLSRYARNARWIGTHRQDPRLPELAGQSLALGPMSEAALRDLLDACAPDADADSVGALVAAAGGSPWRLKRRLLGDDDANAAADVLAGLSAGERALVEALTVLELPVPLEVLAGVAGDGAALDALPVLERRALIDRPAGGVRLHDMAAPLLRESLGREVLARRGEAIAHALAQSADPSALIEAVRLHLRAGRIADVVTTLAAGAEALGASPHLSRLCRMIERVDDERLCRDRLRFAVELGDPAVLATVRVPVDATADDRLLWVRALFRLGRLHEAEQVASAVHADATRAGDAARTFDAGLKWARAVAAQGRIAEAFALANGLVPHCVEAEVERDGYMARGLVYTGRYPAARALVDSVVRRRAVLPVALRREVDDQLISALLYLGRPREAEAVQHVLDAEAGADPQLHFARLRSRLARAGLALDQGRLRDAGELVAGVGRFGARAGYTQPYFDSIELQRRIHAGEFRGIDEAVAAHFASAEAIGDADNYHWAEVAALHVAALYARPMPAPGSTSAMPEATGTMAALLELSRLRFEESPARVPAVPGDDTPHLHVLARTLVARAAMIAGQGERVLEDLAGAVEVARLHGIAPFEAEARAALCEALVLFGTEVAALPAAAEALAALAVQMGSARFEREAGFFRALAAGAPAADALEDFAAALDVAPVSARRAQALLGGAARLDALDRALLEALRRRAGPRRRLQSMRPEPQGAEEWKRGWGLDSERRTVWLPGGRSLDLSRRPLFARILEVIAELGGNATKEQLAERVWGAREYHPLRDDKRMQVAVRKLRLVIEDDPSRPTRLVTTDAGYGFGAREPFRRVRADEPEGLA